MTVGKKQTVDVAQKLIINIVVKFTKNSFAADIGILLRGSNESIYVTIVGISVEI